MSVRESALAWETFTGPIHNIVPFYGYYLPDFGTETGSILPAVTLVVHRRCVSQMTRFCLRRTNSDNQPR